MPLIFEKKISFCNFHIILKQIIKLAWYHKGPAMTRHHMAFLYRYQGSAFSMRVICSSREYVTKSGTIFIDTLDKCRTIDPNWVR